MHHKPFLKSFFHILMFLFCCQAHAQETFHLNTADPNLSQWQVFDEGTTDQPSAWSSMNGTIVQSSNIYGGGAMKEPEKPGTFAISGNPAWTDYRFTVTLLSKDDDSLGVIFRYQNPKNYYRYAMDKQRNVLRLVKFVDGRLFILSELPFAYAKGEWYEVGVNAIGSDIQILLNKRAIITLKDSSHPKGRVGLYTWGNKGASFKEITVTTAGTTWVTTHPSSMDALVREMEILKKEVQALREEALIGRQLQMTEDEKNAEEEELLTAAGREYTLLKKGVMGLEYTLSYSYYSLDAISNADMVNKYSNHTLTHTLFLEAALLNNLTLTMDIPYAFKKYEEGAQEESVNDIGDLRLGFQFQPFKASAGRPAFILTSAFSCPTGKSPYEIDPEKELATGNGIYALSAGIVASRALDPIVTFGSIGYTCNFTKSGLSYPYGADGNATIREVAPGDHISVGGGFAYALSYTVSLNMSYQFTYAMESTYHFREEALSRVKIPSEVSSIFSVGLGLRPAKSRTIITSIAMGLTNEDPDFLVSLRVPFEFNLTR